MPEDVFGPIIGGQANTQRQLVRNKNLGAGNVLVDQTWDLFGAGSTNGVPPVTTGKTFATMCGFLAGDVVSNISICVATAAVGTSPSYFGLGLLSLDTTTVLAATANLLTSFSAKFQSNQVHVFPVATPYRFPADAAGYLALLQIGTWGTTQAAFQKGITTGAVASNSIDGVGSPLSTSSNASNMTQIASFVKAGDASNFWFGWS